MDEMLNKYVIKIETITFRQLDQTKYQCDIKLMN